jgi:hypothetical protein
VRTGSAEELRDVLQQGKLASEDGPLVRLQLGSCEGAIGGRGWWPAVSF